MPGKGWEKGEEKLRKHEKEKRRDVKRRDDKSSYEFMIMTTSKKGQWLDRQAGAIRAESKVSQ